MNTTPEPFVSIGTVEKLVVCTTKVVDFDPFQTKVVTVRYEEFPGFDDLYDNLRRHKLLPLGIEELSATVSTYNSLVELRHEGRSRKALKAREERMGQIESLRRSLELSRDLMSGEILPHLVSSILYIGTVLTDSDPRLSEILMCYPTLSPKSVWGGMRLGTALLQPGFFYADIACVERHD